MQVLLSSFKGDRPLCPVDPKHKVHRHGHYERLANCNDHQKRSIARLLCLPCGRTISVLPDEMLPYRAVPVPLVEKHFDAQAHPSQGQPPPATEREKGCLKRAWQRFKQRTIALATTLGQILQVQARSSAKSLWFALRRLGNLPAILLQLAVPFNTSLLHDYRSLRPWLARPG